MKIDAQGLTSVHPEMHPWMRIQSSSDGREVHVDATRDETSSVETLLGVVRWWSEDQTERAEHLPHREVRNSRLFYVDSIFADFMLRLRLESFDGALLAACYSVARLNYQDGLQTLANFACLRIGLEAVAKRYNASLRYENAEEAIGRNLRSQNYLQIDDVGQLVSGRPTASHWQYHEPFVADRLPPERLIQIVAQRGTPASQFELRIAKAQLLDSFYHRTRHGNDSKRFAELAGMSVEDLGVRITELTAQADPTD